MAAVLLADWFIVYVITNRKYSFCFEKSVYINFILQAAVFVAMVATMRLMPTGLGYWATGAIYFLMSVLLSFYLLSKKMSYVDRLLNRIKRILRW